VSKQTRKKSITIRRPFQFTFVVAVNIVLGGGVEKPKQKFPFYRSFMAIQPSQSHTHTHTQTCSGKSNLLISHAHHELITKQKEQDEEEEEFHFQGSKENHI